jgi:hypothetical protein
MAGGSGPLISPRDAPATHRAMRAAAVNEGRGNTMSPSAGAGGWQDSSYEAYARRRAKRKDDPDNQWSVEEGVTPVLEAPSDPGDHDAPPGVIGIDR